MIIQIIQTNTHTHWCVYGDATFIAQYISRGGFRMGTFYCYLHFSLDPEGDRTTTTTKSNRKTFSMSLVSNTKSTAIKAHSPAYIFKRFGQFKLVCVWCAWWEKNGKYSLGQLWSIRLHWSQLSRAYTTNELTFCELRQLCRIDIYMTIYSCHGNHIGVPNVVFLITMLLWFWIVNLIVYLINVFTVRDLQRYNQSTFAHTHIHIRSKIHIFTSFQLPTHHHHINSQIENLIHITVCMQNTLSLSLHLSFNNVATIQICNQCIWDFRINIIYRKWWRESEKWFF